jgi:AcrR family transcriptional regulator
MASAGEAALAQLLKEDVSDPRDATTERILDATLEQFLAVGLRRTTIEDVARRAGVGRVTIYRRVGQKHQLVQAVILREVNRVISGVAATIAPLEQLEERVVEAFVVGLRALREHPLLQRLLQTEPEDLLPYLTVNAGASLAIGRRFIAAQIRDLEPADHAPGVDPDLIAELLTRLSQSLVLTPEGGIPLEDDARMRSFALACLAPLLHGAPARG